MMLRCSTSLAHVANGFNSFPNTATRVLVVLLFIAFIYRYLERDLTITTMNGDIRRVRRLTE
jgi:hypothetical protein